MNFPGLDGRHKESAIAALPDVLAVDADFAKWQVDKSKYVLGLAVAAAVFVLREIGSPNIAEQFDRLVIAQWIAHTMCMGFLYAGLMFGYIAYTEFYAGEQHAVMARAQAVARQHGITGVGNISAKSRTRFRIQGERAKKWSMVSLLLGIGVSAFL